MAAITLPVWFAGATWVLALALGMAVGLVIAEWRHERLAHTLHLEILRALEHLHAAEQRVSGNGATHEWTGGRPAFAIYDFTGLADPVHVPGVILCDEHGGPLPLSTDILEMFAAYPGVVIIDPETGREADLRAMRNRDAR